MEVNFFEICTNIIQSIMIALFLRSLVTDPRGKQLPVKTVCYAIIEFIYIQWMNTVIGLSGGMYEFFDILICFLYFSISSRKSVFEKITLSLLPTFVIAFFGIPSQFILFSVFGNNWTEIMMNYRIFYVLFCNLGIGILFAGISRFYKQCHTYFNDKIFALLSVSLLVSSFLLFLFEELLYGSKSKYTLFLLLISCTILMITIIIIFIATIRNWIETEKEKSEYVLSKETSFLHSEIREKERYLNELKHNINLFLSLLKSGADPIGLTEKTGFFDSLNKIDTSSPSIPSVAFAAALSLAKKHAKENGISIKTAYLCTSDFNISEHELYLLFSALFETVIQHTIPDSVISIEVKELFPNCKITLIYQSTETGESLLDLPENAVHIIKRNNGEYMLSSHDRLRNSTILLPLKTNRRSTPDRQNQ